ncbi:MAG: ribbon-helix-helix protein, CopG family [Streptococcus agalactiae]|nr:ribbon-helix-helix protein, CopG family [Streptococcus agalactiae]
MAKEIKNNNEKDERYHRVTLHLDDDVYDALEKARAEENRSRNNYVTTILKKHFNI